MLHKYRWPGRSGIVWSLLWLVGGLVGMQSASSSVSETQQYILRVALVQAVPGKHLTGKEGYKVEDTPLFRHSSGIPALKMNSPGQLVRSLDRENPGFRHHVLGLAAQPTDPAHKTVYLIRAFGKYKMNLRFTWVGLPRAGHLEMKLKGKYYVPVRTPVAPH